MAVNLELIKGPDGLYSLLGQTTDVRRQVVDRFTVQLLSKENAGRGSQLLTALEGGQIKTRLSAVAAFGRAALDIRTNITPSDRYRVTSVTPLAVTSSGADLTIQARISCQDVSTVATFEVRL